MFSSRGSRLVKALEKYAKESPMFYDTSTIFNKIKFTSLTDKNLQASFIVDSAMCNGTNAIHGGYVASLIDVSCLYANLGKTNGRMGLTTSLNVNYIKPAKKGDKVNVEVNTIRNGQMPILEALITNEDGSVIAKGTATFYIANEEFQKRCSEIIKFDFNTNE